MKFVALTLVLCLTFTVFISSGCEDRSSEIANLENQLTQQKEVNDKLRAQLTGLQSQVTTPPAITPVDNTALESAKQELQQVEARLTSIQEQLEAQKSQNEELMKALITLRQDLKKLREDPINALNHSKAIMEKIDQIIIKHGGSVEITK